MTRAVITLTITETQLRRLQARCEVITAGWGVTGVRLNENELAALCANTDILLVGYETVSRQVIEQTPALKLIGCARGMPVNIDLDAAVRHGIPVLYTPGRNAIAAAEYTIGLMLSETRHIARSYHALRSGRYLAGPGSDYSRSIEQDDITWNLDGESPFKDFHGHELAGKTLGLIGYGNIGRRVAQLARAFDMRVLYYTPYRQDEEDGTAIAEPAGFDEIFTQSDFVSLHCKVTSETCGMIGRREFNLMKPNAYLINTARAVIVDEDALVDALKQRRISGAALDVYWYEPLPWNHPLLQLENVTLTPHLAGATVEVPERHSRMLVDSVLDWLDGRPPKYVFARETEN